MESFGIPKEKTGFSPYATLKLGSYGDTRKRATAGSTTYLGV
jgi:hypothetical protein